MDTRQDLITYLVNEAEYEPEELQELEPEELIDKFLVWNGIFGFTNDIINAVKAAYKSTSNTTQS